MNRREFTKRAASIGAIAGVTGGYKISASMIGKHPSVNPAKPKIVASDGARHVAERHIAEILAAWHPGQFDPRDSIEWAISEHYQFLANKWTLRLIAHTHDREYPDNMKLACVTFGRNWDMASKQFADTLTAALNEPDTFVTWHYAGINLEIQPKELSPC